MITEEFISSMVSQFRDPKDDERNAAFYKNISSLAYRCVPEGLKKLHDYIVRTEEKTFPFAMGKYYKYLTKNNLEKKENIRKVASWNTCINCGTHYSLVGRGCPKCKEKKATASMGETYPNNFMPVTEDCYYCTIYPEIKKNPKWMTFEGCADFGVKQDAKCNPCQCKECCRQMAMYKSDPHGTVDKYRNGKLAQPWLIEPEPLSKMAADMMAHMRRQYGY